MRLLFLHQFNLDLAGGSGVYLRALCQELGLLGHEITVVSARRPDRYGCTDWQLPFEFTLTFGPEKRSAEKALGEFSNVELQALADRASASIEADAFVGAAPDLILVNHLSLLALSALTLSDKFAVPYRMISYGTDTELMQRDRRFAELVAPAVFGADRVFAISAFVAAQIALSLPGRVVEVLGGAVDARLFYPADGATERSTSVVFVGRLVTEKGIWTLLDAVHMSGDDITLTVAGEGPLLPAIKEFVRTSGLGGRVKLLGYVGPEDLRRVLLDAAVLVIPSTWDEPLGLVALEALACGVPVVGSAVGGIPEMIDDGVNGYLVPPGNASALADALARIIGDSANRERLRENCLQHRRVQTYRELAPKVIA